MNLRNPIKKPLKGYLEDAIYHQMVSQAHSESIIQKFRIELGSGLFINLYERLHNQVVVDVSIELGRFV